MTVAVVTDSTASLPDAAGVAVVPLTVLLDGVPHREGVELGPADLVAALRSGARVTTSQPGPEEFARVYRALVERGATAIVSVHLSVELSGTAGAAETAARAVAIPVTVVDSRTVAGALGRAALAAAAVAGTGADAAAVAEAARSVAGTARVWFAVDTLEHLRAGGRLGPIAAALGTALGVRPVLAVVQGRLGVVEKVRTSRRARERVVDLALADAAKRVAPVVVVQHLGDPAAAAEAVTRLRAGGIAAETWQVSAVIGAHTGPGVLAVVVADA